MNKKWILFSLILILCFPLLPVRAQTIQGEASFFYHNECKHCKKEMKWLKELENEHSNFKVHYFNIHEEDASEHFEKILEEQDISVPQVPFLLFEEQSFVGYLDKEDFLNKQNTLNSPSCRIDQGDCEQNNDRPLALTAMLFGIMDGFNPCAMWVLLVLISLLLQKEKWKDVFILGGTFIIVTALFYYAMLNSWLNLRPIIPHFQTIQKIIAALIILFASYSLYKQYQEKACHMKQGPIRKKMIASIQKAEANSSKVIAILMIAILALFVNLFELACSLGFPLAFIEILSLNNIHGLERQMYLLIYVFFFILDDLIILTIAGVKHRIKPFSSKWQRRIQKISAYLLLVLGLILLFKPQWLA